MGTHASDSDIELYMENTDSHLLRKKKPFFQFKINFFILTWVA